MGRLLKRGLASLILGSTLFFDFSSNSYSQEKPQDYDSKQVNYNPESGFSNRDLVFVGLTTLGAFYFIRRTLKKQ